MKEINETIKEIEVSQQETAVTQLDTSDEFISNFKSLYYLLNATPDTQMQVFNDDRIVTLQDIYELNEKVNAKLHTHNVITNNISIYVSFNDGKGKNFKSWGEFKRTNWNIASTTKSFNIIWDFYIKLPHYQAPQRHSLKVRIGSQLRPDEFFKIMLESESDAQVDDLVANVVCKVDFVNAVICDELINLVRDWYEALQKEFKKNKLVKFYQKYANRISKFIDLIFPIISILLIYAWTDKFLIQHSNFDIVSDTRKTLLWLTSSILIVYIAKYFGFIIASINYRKAKEFIDHSYLYITKGDKNKGEEASLKNRSIVRDISINIIASSLFALIAFIWGFIIDL